MTLQLTFPVPLHSPISQTFEEHLQYARAHPEIPYNGGIDWALPQGHPVVFACGGIAETRYDPIGYGIYVRCHTVDEDTGDSYDFIYAHLSNAWDFAREKVHRSELLGEVGSTGRSTGAHLHFEVRLNGTPIDPFPLLLAHAGAAPLPTSAVAGEKAKPKGRSKAPKEGILRGRPGVARKR